MVVLWDGFLIGIVCFIGIELKIYFDMITCNGCRVDSTQDIEFDQIPFHTNRNARLN